MDERALATLQKDHLEGRNVVITIELHPIIHKQLEEVSRAQGWTVSKTINTCLQPTLGLGHVPLFSKSNQE